MNPVIIYLYSDYQRKYIKFNEYPFVYLIFQNQDIRATPLKINCYHYSTKIPQLRCLIPDIKGR